MGVFGTPQRVLVRGAGCLVWDADGKEYLDLLGGIAVNALGHAHPFVTSVISSQLATLGHVSNFFTSPTQIALAEKLLELSKAPAGSKVFFANSGTEAVEAAFKLARRNSGAGVSGEAGAETADQDHRPRRRLPRPDHGRPGADRQGSLPGAVRAAARRRGAHPVRRHRRPRAPPSTKRRRPSSSNRSRARPASGRCPPATCRPRAKPPAQAGALLILDEVQTGIGRTGKWLASEDAGIVPDAVTLAKGLGGGFPIGALVTFGPEASALLTAGQHGTTFGGNPVATAAALATLHAIESQRVLDNVRDVGEHLRSELAEVDGVTEVRGEGLLIGFDLDADVAPAVVTAGLDAGFIVNSPGPRTIRLAPPLILTTEQADSFLAALPALLQTAKDAQ